MLRMTLVFCNQIPGEQVKLRAAFIAIASLDPKKVFDFGCGIPADQAGRLVIPPNLLAQPSAQASSGILVCIEVEVVDFFPHNPVSHWIYVDPNDIASKPICFKHRGATTHEGVSNSNTRKMMRCIKCFR